MTALQAAVALLTAATALAAASYSSEHQRGAPIARYLLTLIALDFLRLALVSALPADQEVRAGLALGIRHASQAAYIGTIVALPAMSFRLFFRRSSWALWYAAAVLWFGLAASYPAVRGVDLLWVYSGLQLGAGLLSAGFLLTWAMSKAGKVTVTVCSATALIAGSLAVSALPELAGDCTLQNWSANIALQGATFAVVLVLQLWGLFSGRSSRSAKRS